MLTDNDLHFMFMTGQPRLTLVRCVSLALHWPYWQLQSLAAQEAGAEPGSPRSPMSSAAQGMSEAQSLAAGVIDSSLSSDESRAAPRSTASAPAGPLRTADRVLCPPLPCVLVCVSCGCPVQALPSCNEPLAACGPSASIHVCSVSFQLLLAQ